MDYDVNLNSSVNKESTTPCSQRYVIISSVMTFQCRLAQIYVRYSAHF